MWNAMQHLRYVAGHIGVPGVGVDNIGVAGLVCHLEVDSEDLEGGIRISQLGDVVVPHLYVEEDGYAVDLAATEGDSFAIVRLHHR